MSLIDHKDWPLIRPHVYLSTYDGQANEEGKCTRICFSSDAPPEVRRIALDMKAPCPACDQIIYRVIDNYVRASCGYSSPGCSRTNAASEEVQKIRADLGEKFEPISNNLELPI